MSLLLPTILGLALAQPLLPVAPTTGPPVRWTAAPMALQIAPGDECRLDIALPFTVLEAGWVELPLVGPELVLTSATLDGRSVRLAGHDQGLALIARMTAGQHVVELRGTAACVGSQLQLGLPVPAPVRLEVSDPSLTWTVPGVHTGPARWDLPDDPSLRMSWAPARAAPPRPRVLRHTNAVALRVDEGGIEGKALLRHSVHHGTMNSVTVRIPGGVEEVKATGAGVVGATAAGELVTISLNEAVEGFVNIALDYRTVAPGDEGAAAPIPQPTDGRGETVVVLYRGDDAVLLPEPGPGLEAISMRRVPREARGLVPGEPLVSYLAAEGRAPELSLRQLRFSPVDQPPTVIDDARYTVVHAAHGRAWMRAIWQVRNDRNPFLTVDVPAGWQVFGLRVAGNTAEPVRDEQGRLLVPLEKSVETLDGLVAFPVELMLVGEDAAWDARGIRALATPAVDAPIAYARWELRLPDDVDPRDVSGRPTVVSRWTPADQGMLIGRGTKAASAPTSSSMSEGEQLSQEYWNQAYSAYKSNEFDKADALLEKSLQMNPDNASASSLLGNIDVLKNRGDAGRDQAMASNRVRALAKAKSGDVELKQAEKEQALKQALRSGDQNAAADAAEDLLQLTETLAAVEQVEAVEQKERLSSYRSQAEDLRGKSGKKKTVARADESRSTGLRSVVDSAVAMAPPADDTGVAPRLAAVPLPSPPPPPPPPPAMVGDLLFADADDWSVSPEEPMPPMEQEALMELDGVYGGVEGGVVGGVLGGVAAGAVGNGMAVHTKSAEVEPMPEPMAQDAPMAMELSDEESDRRPVTGRTMSESMDMVVESGEKAVDLDEGKRGAVITREQLERIPSGRSYQSSVEVAAGTTASVSGHARRNGMQPRPPSQDSVEDVPAAFPVRNGPAEAFPVDGRPVLTPPLDAPSPPARRVGPGPEGPAFPTASGADKPAFPVHQGAMAAPRRAQPASAWPRRPAPPPAAAFGLDVPKTISASTLSLSLPEGGARLLLEQRVVPADEPLQLDLRYRPARHRGGR